MSQDESQKWKYKYECPNCSSYFEYEEPLEELEYCDCGSEIPVLFKMRIFGEIEEKYKDMSRDCGRYVWITELCPKCNNSMAWDNVEDRAICESYDCENAEEPDYSWPDIQNPTAEELKIYFSGGELYDSEGEPYNPYSLAEEIYLDVKFYYKSSKAGRCLNGSGHRWKETDYIQSDHSDHITTIYRCKKCGIIKNEAYINLKTTKTYIKRVILSDGSVLGNKNKSGLIMTFKGSIPYHRDEVRLFNQLQDTMERRESHLPFKISDENILDE